MELKQIIWWLLKIKQNKTLTTKTKQNKYICFIFQIFQPFIGKIQENYISEGKSWSFSPFLMKFSMKRALFQSNYGINKPKQTLF